MTFVPVNEPLLNGDEEKYLLACLRTGWISSEGPYVKQFEERVAAYVGRNYGIAVANGTAALDVAVAALDIGPGDEVIMPTLTIISCITQIIRIGAKPVFVDSDPLTWNMDVAQIAAKITTRTKAIMIVHIYGLPVDIDPVLELADRYNLKVIEDAAQMFGQTYKGDLCGSFGDISTFSFYPNKHITTGEGGLIVTGDEALYERCRSLRNLCFQQHKRFVHEELGWNYRITNLQAALGLAQFERVEQHLAKKRAIGQYYAEQLAGLPNVRLPIKKTKNAENIYWVYGLVIDENFPLDATEVIDRLHGMGVGARPFFWPMHEQPVFTAQGLFVGERYPVAENLARRGFYIPSGLGLDETQQQKVVTALRCLFK